MEETIRDLENEKAMLEGRVEELSDVVTNLQQYCNNINSELNQVKEENIRLMRMVIMYQSKEIQELRSEKPNE